MGSNALTSRRHLKHNLYHSPAPIGIKMLNQPFFQVALPLMLTMLVAVWLNNKALDKAFDAVHKRLDDIVVRIGHIEERLLSIETRLTAVERKVDALELKKSS